MPSEKNAKLTLAASNGLNLMVDETDPAPLAKGGGGGNDGRMEARVAELEKTMSGVRERLASIEAKVDSVDKYGAKSHEISALESRMTRWFIGTALAIGGIAFAIARFIS